MLKGFAEFVKKIFWNNLLKESIKNICKNLLRESIKIIYWNNLLKQSIKIIVKTICQKNLLKIFVRVR